VLSCLEELSKGRDHQKVAKCKSLLDLLRSSGDVDQIKRGLLHSQSAWIFVICS
jgi:hypothetical protein